jgi:NodT family efflux transporter outer membrane factor (OMF) lipoprotein
MDKVGNWSSAGIHAIVVDQGPPCSTAVSPAKADATATGADRYPQFSAAAKAGRSSVPVELESGPEVSRVTDNAFELKLNLQWEIDVWGRLANLQKAAGFDMVAARADFEGARLSLTAQVTNAWLDMIVAEKLYALAVATEQNYAFGASKIQDRYKRGISSAFDLRLAISDHTFSKDAVLARAQRRSDAARYIQVLVGRYPDASLALETELPELKDNPPAGMPADLISRRPDIRAAHQRLEAADARLFAAGKAFLPQFALTGDMGRTSSELEDITRKGYRIWQLLGGLTQPLFQGGRLKAQFRNAEIKRDQACVSYAESLTTAFTEVEQALTNEYFWHKRLSILEQTALQSTAAEQSALKDYAGGQIDIIAVLEARRRALTARNDLLEAKLARLKNRVNLHLALGGDFKIKGDRRRFDENR